MKIRNISMICIIGLGVLVFLLPVQGTAAQGILSLEFYGDEQCHFCNEKKPIVEDFVARHPEVSAVYIIKHYLTNTTESQELQDYFASFGVTVTSIPVVLLNNSGTINVLMEGQVNAQALEAWIGGYLDTDITLWESFLLGLAFGGSPCLLLVMSVLGTTLVTIESRKKYLAISIGLILGLIAAYIVISIIFLAFLNFISFLAYFRYIFGAILLTIGIWEIVEFKKEKSTIFGTPERVKTWLKSFIEKQSGPYAFLLGMLFAFVKVPCVGGVYLTIMYNAWLDPLFIWYVILYYMGMILPVVILLVALRIGLSSNRINSFREKYRPHLRLVGGIILIALTVYLLLL